MSNQIVENLHRQAAFSKATFGPGVRTEGVLDHISKEIEEVRNADSFEERVDEWADLVILSLDGLIREIKYNSPSAKSMDFLSVASVAWSKIQNKQCRNELRDWPDWRTQDPNKAIEHVRSSNESNKARLDIVPD